MDDQNQAPQPPQLPQPTNLPPPAEAAPVVPSDLEPATAQSQPPVYGAPRPVAPSTFDQNQQPASQPLPVKRKKWPIIAVIAAVLLLLLGGGVAAAYTFWYQNPDRVVMDGIAKALQAKTLTYTGSVNMANQADGMTVKLDLAGAAASGNANLNVTATVGVHSQEYVIKGKGTFDKAGILYVRFENLDTALKAYLKNSPDSGLPEGTQDLADTLVAKFNDRWIKISSSDIEDFSPEGSKTLTCMNKALDSLRNDQNVRKEVTALYQKNPFIHIDKGLGTKNGSLGYEISPDERKQKAFMNGMKDTSLYKKIHDCDADFTIDEQDMTMDDIKNERTEIWVSQWQHEITKLTVHGEDKDGAMTDVVWQPTFNKPVTIDMPKDATTLSELQADIQNAISEYMMTQMSAESSSMPGHKL